MSALVGAVLYCWGVIRVIRSDREYWYTARAAGNGLQPEPSSTAEFLTFGCAIQLIFSSMLWGFCWYALRFRRRFERISANRHLLDGKPEDEYRCIVLNGTLIIWSAITALSAVPYFVLT